MVKFGGVYFYAKKNSRHLKKLKIKKSNNKTVVIINALFDEAVLHFNGLFVRGGHFDLWATF